MPRYVIERHLPGAGSLSEQELSDIARTSVDVLAGLSGRAQWLQSYVTDDKLFCVYIADGPASIEEHAATGGFPCDAVHAVRRVIDPTTAGA